MGLPPVSLENESVALIYEAIYSQLNNGEKETSEDGFMDDALKNILRKFELLESTPVVYSATKH